MASVRKQTSRTTISPAPAIPFVATGYLWAVGLVTLAALLAYSNSFSGPFVYDDDQAVIKNTSIQHLWPIGTVLLPPGELTVGGRPVVNLTFALNYAVSGMHVWSYHVLNLLIHLLAGLTLFGITRRTLQQPALRDRFGFDSVPLALAIAFLWILHPVQTDSVTYISQRAESLMGLFYFLTLYCFIRATGPSAHPMIWSSLCVCACLLGMASKEVMITAPLMIFIYDRTFVAGSFQKAWQLRWRLYAFLAGTWLFLGYLLTTIGQREVGFGRGVAWWSYALTECQALVDYLALIVWPHPIVIDYGMTMVTDPLKVLPEAILLLLLLVGAIVAFVRWPVPGFVGAWFFIILAPTSSVIPIILSPIGEHRLYLPLASVLAFAVLGLFLWLGRKSLGVVAVLALIYGTLTFVRNDDYRSALSLWETTAAQCPDNARAHNNYGVSLLSSGRLPEALAEFQQAVALNPLYADAQYNWGSTLLQLGNSAESIAHFQAALNLDPKLPGAHNNWGNALINLGRVPEAISHYQAALQLNPSDARTHYNWAHALLQINQYAAAIVQCQEALQLNPNLAEAHNSMGIAFFQLGRKTEGIEEFQEAVRIDPNYTPASDNLNRIGAMAK